MFGRKPTPPTPETLLAARYQQDPTLHRAIPGHFRAVAHLEPYGYESLADFRLEEGAQSCAYERKREAAKNPATPEGLVFEVFNEAGERVGIYPVSTEPTSGA